MTDWLTVRLTEAYSAPYVTLHIHNLAIFWALAYLEPEAYLKPCEMLMRHIQNPAIGHCSAIFRHIQNLAQHLQLQKPGILGILEYSVPFHNGIPTHSEPCHIYENLRMFRTLRYLKLNTYSEPSQRFKIEFFLKNSLKIVIIFPERSILDHWPGSEYAYLSISTQWLLQWPRAMYCMINI